MKTEPRLVPDEINAANFEVHLGETFAGVLFDETLAKLARGGWAAWSPKSKNRGGIVGFFESKEEAADAIAALYDDEAPAPSSKPDAYAVKIEHNVHARPGVYEDRFEIFLPGTAEPVERFTVPSSVNRSDRDALRARGWLLMGGLDYLAGGNYYRGTVERTLAPGDTPAPAPKPRNCTPVNGGAVHTSHDPSAMGAEPFPYCRTGGSSNQGTQYRYTDASLSCSTCITYEKRRAAVAR